MALSSDEKKERSRLAQKKYRSKLVGEQARKVKERRRLSMRKYRDKLKENGIIARLILLTDDEYNKVLAFLVKIRKSKA